MLPCGLRVAAQQRDPGADHPAVHLLDVRLYAVLQALHRHEVGLGVVQSAQLQMLLPLRPQQHRLTDPAGVVRRLRQQPLAGDEVVHVLVRDDLLGEEGGVDGAERGEPFQREGVLARVERDLPEREQGLDVGLPVAGRDGGTQRVLAGLPCGREVVRPGQRQRAQTGQPRPDLRGRAADREGRLGPAAQLVGEVQVPQRTAEGCLEPAERLHGRLAGQQPVPGRERLPVPAGPGQGHDRLLTHGEPRRPCDRHEFQRARHEVGREARRDRQHVVGGAPEQRHRLLVPRLGAPENVRHHVDRLVARGDEPARGLPVQSLPGRGRDVHVHRLAQQVVPEDQLVAVVLQKPRAQRLLQCREQRDGRPAAERRGVVEAETAAQHRSHLKEAQRVGVQRAEPAADAHHQPRRHRGARGVGGPQSREHLDGQERIPARSGEQLAHPLVDGGSQGVTGQPADGRAGQRAQGQGAHREVVPHRRDDLLRRPADAPPLGEQPQHGRGPQAAGQLLEGEPAQRVGPLYVVQGDQHGYASGSLLDHLRQALHQPDPLVVPAREIDQRVAGQQGPVAVHDTGRQRRQRHEVVQFVGLAETDGEARRLGRGDGFGQERGLADARFPAEQDERAATGAGHRVDQRPELFQLGLPAAQTAARQRSA